MFDAERITFGTGGWRAVIGEGFTMANVRRLAQALAGRVRRAGGASRGVLIGYDRRFLSDRAARVAAEVFAGNGVPVLLTVEAVPTPLVTYATAAQGAAMGLCITSSHNPPEWNGVKVFHGDGSLLMTAETDEVEAEANRLTAADVRTLPLEEARAAGLVRRVDFLPDYLDAVEAQVDMAAIRRAGLRVAFDAMHGTGAEPMAMLLAEARCRVRVLHGERDPLFGGRSPAPEPDALRSLAEVVRTGGYDVGLATDGDADRLAVVDAQGRYVPMNELLLLVYDHLHRRRGMRGGVVRNVATTHLLDRLAAHFGERCYEVPVGFKHIAAAMQAHDALLGGESSGGLTVRGYMLGKDGLLAAALVVEMLALSGRTLAALLEEVYAVTGRLYALEARVPVTEAMRRRLPERLRAGVSAVAGRRVERVSHRDGTKFWLEGGAWVLLRFSGTEPVLRLFAEAETPDAARALMAWARALAREK